MVLLLASSVLAPRLTAQPGPAPRGPEAAAAPSEALRQRDRLGAKVRNLSGREAEEMGWFSRRGAVVVTVAPGSPAARAGLRPGDLVLRLDRRRIEGAAQFESLLAAKPSDATVELGLWGQDGEVSTKARLVAGAGPVAGPGPRAPQGTGAAPAALDRPPVDAPESRTAPAGPEPAPIARDTPHAVAILTIHIWLGVDVRHPRAREAAALGWRKPRGVKVIGVLMDSPLAGSDLLSGDVITALDGTEVVDADALLKSAVARQNAAVRLSVLRGGRRREISASLPPARDVSAIIDKVFAAFKEASRLFEEGRFVDAAAAAGRVAEDARNSLGEETQIRAEALELQAEALQKQMRRVQALPLRRQAVSMFEAVLPENHGRLVLSQARLGLLLADLGRRQDAEAARRRILAGAAANPQVRTQQEVAMALERLGDLLRRPGRPIQSGP